MPPRPTLKKSLRAIERAFADIAALADALTDRVRVAERGAGRATTLKRRRKLTITPKRHAQLKLQGAYMGFMRQLGPRQQARVRAVRRSGGSRRRLGWRGSRRNRHGSRYAIRTALHAVEFPSR